MEVQNASEAGMDGWNGDRAVVGLEREMTDQCFVENLIDRVLAIFAPLSQPSYGRSLS